MTKQARRNREIKKVMYVAPTSRSITQQNGTLMAVCVCGKINTRKASRCRERNTFFPYFTLFHSLSETHLLTTSTAGTLTKAARWKQDELVVSFGCGCNTECTACTLSIRQLSGQTVSIFPSGRNFLFALGIFPGPCLWVYPMMSFAGVVFCFSFTDDFSSMQPPLTV